MILYLDTTTNYLYTGIVDNNKLICEVKEKLDKELSTYTLVNIKNMFLENKIDPTSIDKIIVVNGPGSFTGIRIGLTIAKVWAHLLNKPLIAISSIDAMSISCSEGTYKVPVIDARRGYVFTGIYDKDNNEVLKPSYLGLEELLDRVNELDKPYTLISNTSYDINEYVAKYTPSILKIVNTVKDRDTIEPHALLPNYLKLTEAEENLIKEETHD